MHRTSFLFVAAAALSAGVAFAQTSAPAPTQLTSPTPAVENAGATTVVQAPSTAAPATAGTTPVTQIVYSPQLPNVADLTSAASSQGLTIERVVQTAGQVIVFYRNASGQATTVAYQSLPPSAGAAPASAPQAAPVVTPTPAPRVVVVSPPQPTVVYTSAPRVVYYDDYYPRYYYPRTYYPPVSFSFGVGYRSYHGGHRYHHHHHRRR